MVIKIINKVLLIICLLIISINAIFVFQRMILKENLPKIFGFSQAVVTSNSMDPYIKKGDFLIFKEKDNYEISDVVIFSESDYYITHRIVDSNEEGFITKGDNNSTNDNSILNQDNIEGELIFKIPKLGTFLDFITSFTGIVLVLVIFFIIFLLRKIDFKKVKIKNLGLIIFILISFTTTTVAARYIIDILGLDEAKVATIVMDGNLSDDLNITLQGINPGEVRLYDFSIINYNGEVVSEVKQDYNIIINTTNNLPLLFELVIVQDSGFIYASDFVYDNTNYVALNGVLGNEVKEEHKYQLKITYQTDSANVSYVDEIDVISLAIDSVQKID